MTAVDVEPVALLGDVRLAMDPNEVDFTPLHVPGLYSWWADVEARRVIGEALQIEVGELVYVGQAGATKWPSGTRSRATLASRVGRQHLAGNIRSSTFRLTISSLLQEPLGLTGVRGRLDRESNAQVTAWIATHLRVNPVPFPAADALGAAESTAAAEIDPPLNLDHVPRTLSRSLLRQCRALLRAKAASHSERLPVGGL